ncbi:MAG: helix-turn-helix transcriptional regulator [Planctomycetes bacterium]|nr:helix-turn-helix transcriptional regulator [Planctomycetota bacterium]
MTRAEASNHLFDATSLAVLLDPGRWRLVTSLFPSESTALDDRPHRNWRLRHTHAHPHREFMMSLAGDALYGHPAGIIRCDPGTCLYFDALEPHDDGYPVHVAGARHLWISVARGWVHARQLFPRGGHMEQPLAAVSLGVADMGFDAALALDRCRAEAATDPRLARLDLGAVLQALIARIVDSGWRSSAEPDASHRARAIAAVREHIAENAGAGVTLGGLAHLSGYSRFHLARAFRAETGMTLRAWIDRCRLERVQELIARDVTMEDAAAEIGFSSASALSRWCRRHGTSWKSHRARTDAT